MMYVHINNAFEEQLRLQRRQGSAFDVDSRGQISGPSTRL